MKRQLAFGVMLCLFSMALAQDFVISYENRPGPGTDTVVVFFQNNTSSNLLIGAANTSILFNATATFDTVITQFDAVWGFTFVRGEQIFTGPFISGGQSYDYRWQYGNTSLAGISIPLPVGPPVEMMRLIFSASVPSLKKLEDNIDNLANDFSNETSFILYNYIIQNGPVGLPVEWLSFEAIRQTDGSVQLDWKTASELDNDHFVVEKSRDGLQFYQIGRVEGQGNSQQINAYQLLDRGPLYPVNFYRIKQVDINGGFAYSELRELRLADLAERFFTLTPNPVTGPLRLESSVRSNRRYTLTISSLAGQQLYQANVQIGEQSWEKDMSVLPEGVYFLHLVDDLSGQAFAFKWILTR